VCVDEFIGGINEIFADPVLGDEVHHGEQEERLVRCTMVRDRRIAIPPPVGAKLCERLEVFLKHLSVQEQRALVCSFSKLRVGQIPKVIK